MKKILIAILGLAFAVSLLPARAADDSNLQVTKAYPSAGATNTTSAIDLGTDEPGQIWRMAYVRADIPATANATNSATTFLFTLQDSADNVTFANTTPLVQLQITGASSVTNTAQSVKLPIPPGVQRYIRVQQIAPTASGANTGVTNTFTLAVP